jgi:proline iminopeptidase
VETVIKTGSVELWTTQDGRGGPVLLCNGGPGCCDYLEPVAEMLMPWAQVVRWEQRGCGRSTTDGDYSLATTLADMETIRRHYGFERWIVGGHSWGADLALAYAWHHPERVAGLIAISGGLLVKDRSWNEAYHAGKDGRGGGVAADGLRGESDGEPRAKCVVARVHPSRRSLATGLGDHLSGALGLCGK